MIDTDDVQPVVQPEAAVGVDLGVTTLATLSTGEAIEGPKSPKAALKSLRRANKAMAHVRGMVRNRHLARAKSARDHLDAA